MALVTIRAGVQFRPDAAASFRRYEHRIGRRADVNRTVVPRLEQMTLWLLRQAGKYPYAVAHPDASNHVYQSDTRRGNAWDTDERNYALLAEYGWIAVWNDPRREPYEPWHLEYFPQHDQHRHEGIPTGSNATTLDTDPDQEDDTMRFIDGPNIIIWPNGVINSYGKDDYTLIQQFVRYPTHPDWSKGRGNFERAAWEAFNFGTSATAAAVVKSLPADVEGLSVDELAALIRDLIPDTWTVTAA